MLNFRRVWAKAISQLLTNHFNGADVVYTRSKLQMVHTEESYIFIELHKMFSNLFKKHK